MKPRSLAPYRPLRLTSNLGFILRAKDTESLFDVEATRRALRGKNIDLEAVLRPGLYWHVKPAPKRLGYKVGPDAVIRMKKFRKRGLSYWRIAGELDLSMSTVRKYVKEIWSNRGGKITRRPIGEVRRARGMHGKGLRVCEISRRLGIPPQTISDWISGRWRPEERPEAPGFSVKAKRKIRWEPLGPVLRGIITGVAGERGCEVARALLRKEVTDDEVAKRTNMRVNLVRKILYELYENRVASYRRTRAPYKGI